MDWGDINGVEFKSRQKNCGILLWFIYFDYVANSAQLKFIKFFRPNTIIPDEFLGAKRSSWKVNTLFGSYELSFFQRTHHHYRYHLTISAGDTNSKHTTNWVTNQGYENGEHAIADHLQKLHAMHFTPWCVISLINQRTEFYSPGL